MAKSTNTAIQAAKPPKQTRRYRILQGKHVEGNKKNGEYSKGDRGPGVYRVYDAKSPNPEDTIIETTFDLLKLNNPQPMAPRFCLESDAVAIAKHTSDNVTQPLEQLTEEQLRAIADREEIDVSKVTKKEDLVGILRRHDIVS